LHSVLKISRPYSCQFDQNKMKHIKSILLVDDDNITNYINVHLLKKLDIADEIFISTNGVEGLKCLEKYCLKNNSSQVLIILDINMPVMDGFEFLKKIQSINLSNKDQITIAILSTSTNSKDIKEMEALGIKHYFNKPLTQKTIFNLLNTIR
jgi:CheY-like chemotaxis protein